MDRIAENNPSSASTAADLNRDALPRRSSGYSPEKTAQQLLEEFQITGRQEPFEEIVRRYAGMVYHVCLKVTRNNHDAEDATQAVFLTLAVRGKTIGAIHYIGPWLQQVAHRLSLDLKRSKTRRDKREEKHTDNENRRRIVETPAEQLNINELRGILREEVDKLPTKYRMPLILHYFGGLRPEEMAKELGTKASTLGVRLHRGRKMLAESLTARGIDMSGAVLGAMLIYIIQDSISESLISRTCAAAVQLSTGQDMGAVVSASVLAMTQSTQHAITMARIRGAVATVLLFGAAVAGGREVLHRVPELLNIKLPSLTEWLKPMFQSILPSLRADASTPPLKSDRAAFKDFPQFALDSGTHLPNWIPQSLSGNPSSGDVIETYASGEMTGGASSAGNVISALTFPQIAPVETIAAAPARPFSLNLGSSKSSVAFTQIPNYTITSTAPARSTPRSTADLASFMRGNSLVLGESRGSRDSVNFNQNTNLRVQNLVVGKAGHAQITQTGGTVNVSDQLTLGKDVSASGSYELRGGKLTARREVVGGSGRGNFLQSGGEHHVSADLVIGEYSTGHGSYDLRDGSLAASSIAVGDAGLGKFYQSGGSVQTGGVNVGIQPSGNGFVRITKGSFNLVSADSSEAASGLATVIASPPPTHVVIGDRGSGMVAIGGSNGTPIITSSGGSRANLTVRADAAAEGTIRGWGQVNLSGALEQNGRVIADGFGESRNLDFSTVSLVFNTINNSSVDGTNGWYAYNKGALDLPPLCVHGDASYFWGDSPGSSTNDLVNSVKLTTRGVSTPGKAVLRLLASDSDSVPAFPDDQYAIGIWEIGTLDQLSFDSADVSVRYDDRLISLLGQSDSAAVVWEFSDGTWQMLQTASLNTNDKLITASIDGEAQFFAVAVPPSGLLAALGPVDPIGGLAPTGSGDIFSFSQPVPEPVGLMSLLVIAPALLARRRRE